MQWVRLEHLVRELMPSTDQRSLPMPTSRTLERMQLLDPEMRFELDQLRRIRNQLVHGIEVPSADYLHEVTQRLDVLIREIERRRDSQ
jgi:uncharacterized protein YutE (UPF0331/DUF86 family)